MSAPAIDPTLRLFFGLWPGAGLRAQFASHLRLWHFAPPARAMRPEKLHLTLLFMDGVPATELPRLLRIGAAVAGASSGFALTLDLARVWARSGIAHLAPSTPPQALGALQARLQDAVLAARIPCDVRPFRPHLTLARRAEACACPAHFPALAWPADELALVQSVLGSGRYELRGRWALGDAAQPPA